jgi:hypothetical protein
MGTPPREFTTASAHVRAICGRASSKAATRLNVLSLDLSGRSRSVIICLVEREGDRGAAACRRPAAATPTVRHPVCASSRRTASVYRERQACLELPALRPAVHGAISLRCQLAPARSRLRAIVASLRWFPLDFPNLDAVACLTTFILSKRRGAAGTWGAHADRRKSSTEEWEAGMHSAASVDDICMGSTRPRTAHVATRCSNPVRTPARFPTPRGVLELFGAGVPPLLGARAAFRELRGPSEMPASVVGTTVDLSPDEQLRQRPRVSAAPPRFVVPAPAWRAVTYQPRGVVPPHPRRR